jgi:hypothetical protein
VPSTYRLRKPLAKITAKPVVESAEIETEIDSEVHPKLTGFPHPFERTLG